MSVLTGGFIIIYSLRTSKKRQLNEVQALMWVLGGLGVMTLGLFPELLTWFAEILGVYWPPATLVFFLLVVIFYILFSHSKAVSVLTSQVAELTMQLTLVKHENQLLQKKVNEITNAKNKDE